MPIASWTGGKQQGATPASSGGRVKAWTPADTAAAIPKNVSPPPVAKKPIPPAAQQPKATPKTQPKQAPHGILDRLIKDAKNVGSKVYDVTGNLAGDFNSAVAKNAGGGDITSKPFNDAALIKANPNASKLPNKAITPAVRAATGTAPISRDVVLNAIEAKLTLGTAGEATGAGSVAADTIGSNIRRAAISGAEQSGLSGALNALETANTKGKNAKQIAGNVIKQGVTQAGIGGATAGVGAGISTGIGKLISAKARSEAVQGLHELGEPEAAQAISKAKTVDQAHAVLESIRTPSEPPTTATVPKPVSTATMDLARAKSNEPSILSSEAGSAPVGTLATGGAGQFIKEDVGGKIGGAVQGAKNVVNDVKSIVAPASLSKNAHETALAVRKYKAGTANAAAVEASAGKKAHNFFATKSDADNVANISAYERTGQFGKEPVAGYSKIYRDSTDYSHQLNQQTYGNNELGKIDNYVRRNWVFGDEADAKKAVTAIYNYSRSLKPSTSNLKHRTLDVPLDEAQKILDDRGIKAKLATTNPEILRQQTVASATQAAGYKALGEDLKNSGLIQFVRGSGSIPEGMAKLDDRAFQILYPSEQGLVKAGAYFASPDVAKVLNNAISSGLESSAVYRGVRNIKNNINMINLGLSGFHGVTTTLNASINDLTLGFKEALSGNPIKGATAIGRGLIPGASVIRQTYLGSKAFKLFREGSPEAAQVLEKVINPAGFRLKAEDRYQVALKDNMKRAFANGNVFGGATRGAGVALEAPTQAIMQHLVPNAKLGAFLDRAQSIMADNPGLGDKEMAGLLSKASDSMDNTYGQLVYDNLFWNKTFKDVAMLTQRSVGWNLGTVREVGGGLTDILTKTLRGKDVSDRTLYALALPSLIGTYGAVYQYLHTGHGPTSLKDYFYPKTGDTNKNGDPERISLPSYMKDVVGYATNPLNTIKNKQSPILSMVSDILTNQNYYGDLIRNTQDSKGKQLEQVGKYVLSNLQPFSFQSGQNRVSKSKESLAESLAGLNVASGAVTRTSFANRVLDAYHQQLNFGPMTPEQQDTLNAKTKAKDQIKSGGGTGLAQQLAKQGTIPDVDKFAKNATSSQIQTAFGGLSMANKATLLQNASKQDLAQLGDLNAIRLQAASTLKNKNATPANQKAAAQVIKILGGNADDLYQQVKTARNAKSKATRAAHKR